MVGIGIVFISELRPRGMLMQVVLPILEATLTPWDLLAHALTLQKGSRSPVKLWKCANREVALWLHHASVGYCITGGPLILCCIL